MELAPVVQWAAFAVLAAIAVAGALGMTTTMSMFRSGIFLMASFCGAAGLYLLLMADLVGLLQVMMYIGGMLVMILFMLLFSGDPGGSKMASHMHLSGPEWLFSLGLAREQKGNHGHEHGEGEHRGQEHGGHERAGGGGGHADMSMFTPAKRPAMVLAALTAALLCTLILWRPAWAVVAGLPDQRSAWRIGHLLMGRYMIAFEGAGLLILLGIFGAVFLARPGSHPDPDDRERLQAAVDDDPAPSDAQRIEGAARHRSGRSAGRRAGERQREPRRGKRPPATPAREPAEGACGEEAEP